MSSDARLMDLSDGDYHADKVSVGPTLSASIASILVEQSPAHAYAAHPKLGGIERRTTPAMMEGRIRHSILLGQPSPVVVVDADDFRTKDARAQRDDALARGLVPMVASKYADLMAETAMMAESIRAAGVEFTGGVGEQTIAWSEYTSLGPVACRGRMDYLVASEAHIYDLKTVESAHPRACEAHMIRYGAAIQEAAYRSAVETLLPDMAGRVKFTFVFVENDPPHAVTVATSAGSMLEIGRGRWCRAVELWAQCLQSGKWPGYGRIEMHAPAWALAQELSDEG